MEEIISNTIQNDEGQLNLPNVEPQHRGGSQAQTNGGGPPKRRVRSNKRVQFALIWLQEHPDQEVTASALANLLPETLQSHNRENVLISLREGLKHHPLATSQKRNGHVYVYKWNGTVKEEKYNFLPQVQQANNMKCVPTNHRYMHLTETSIFCEKCGDIIHG